MLDRIVIEGLFGQYDYNLPLVRGRRKDICFLTGPNGYGKSTILQLIFAFLKSDARTLASIIMSTRKTLTAILLAKSLSI